MKKLDKPRSLKSARTLTITYNLPISKTAKFWDELKEGKVYTTKCAKCGVLHFPPVADCGVCGSSGVDWVELDCRLKDDETVKSHFIDWMPAFTGMTVILSI